jgi:hypothetical protein
MRGNAPTAGTTITTGTTNTTLFAGSLLPTHSCFGRADRETTTTSAGRRGGVGRRRRIVHSGDASEARLEPIS